MLARNRGRLMTHRALLIEVWGPEYADDVQVLRVHIANLRRKIGETPLHPHRPRRRLPLRGLTKSVYGGARSVRALDRPRSSISGMDIVAVALALLAFIALYGLIELVDRI